MTHQSRSGDHTFLKKSVCKNVSCSNPDEAARGSRGAHAPRAWFDVSLRDPSSFGSPRRAIARAARPTRSVERAPRVRDVLGRGQLLALRRERHAMLAPAPSRYVRDLRREGFVSARKGALTKRDVRQRQHVYSRPPALSVCRVRGQSDLRARAHPQSVR